MELGRFLVSPAPHIRSGESTQRIMLDVIIALLPAMIAGVWFFGINAILVTAVAVVAAVASEAVMQKYVLKRPVTVSDLSAAVTGILIAFNVPATLPLWMVALGSIFAIVIVKQCFGGLGNNFINPALAARAFLLTSFAGDMTNWVAPGADAVAAATPLGLVKGAEAATQALPSLMDLFIGNVPGCIGETSAALLLLGGLYLVYRGVISIRIPASFIATVAVLTFLMGGFDASLAAYHVFAGGLFLGAIFMATDYSSSPMTPMGQIIMGIGCGLITVVIRFFGALPEGVSYSILLMNVATPLIDKFTIPKKFGGVKKSA